MSWKKVDGLTSA